MQARYQLKRTSDGKEIELRPLMVVGRQETCDIVVSEGHASRRHAVLSIENGTVFVNDEGSSNGTFVNGARIAAKTAVRPGDTVRFDIAEFSLGGSAPADDRTVMRPAAAPAPTPAPSAPAVPPAAVPSPPPAPPARAAEAAAAPRAPRPSAESVGDKRPPSWIQASEGGDAAGSKTVMFGRRELAAEVTADIQLKPSEVGERVSVPTLLIKSGALAGRPFELVAGPQGAAEWTIGSDAQHAVSLPDAGVSASHAAIQNESGRWKIVDKMSANGTFVNGKGTTSRYLSSGDRIRFGQIESVFLVPGGATHAATSTTTERTRSPRGVIIGIAAFVITVIVVAAVLAFLRH